MSPVLDSAQISVVTDRPVEEGEEVGAGGLLTEISDRPILVLPGAIPMLRDLHVGDRGDDVERLQVALRDAGFGSADASGVFGRSTVAAMTRLYAAHDYAPPRDSDPAATAYAAQRELVFIDDLPATVVSLPHPVGEAVEGTVAVVGFGTPIVTVTAPAPVEVAPATPVVIRLASGTRSWAGRVVTVGKRRLSEEGGAVVDVKVSLRGDVPGSVVGRRVSVTTKEQPPVGLIVPLSAVHSRADGTLYVTVVDSGKESPTVVAVLETGDGSARIKPAVTGAVSEGDEVAVGIDR